MDGTVDKEVEQSLLFHDSKNEETWKKPQRQISYILSRLHIVSLYLYCVAISVALGILLAQNRDPTISVYSPASTEVSYSRTTFEPGTPDQLSAYQGLPDETKNHLWEALYQRGGATRITGNEAQKLGNNTYEIPEGDGEHVIQLEVFHQLHCLNTLRRSLWPDSFPKYSLSAPNGDRIMHRVMHADHCVDRLRQGVLCASNIGVSSWRRRPGTPTTGKSFEERLAIDMRSTMMCRDFERIQEWAFARQIDDWEGHA